ncbi:hypothetical protein MNBD_GAMMA10-2537 [hydrothermal vent metagenome]|uniref:DUF6316 domain-containing protein n=1 Tax=hydrothermal vent metagenome TaxID=652676 RepID=A0A3B0XYT3_9ZZZZ
MNESSRSSEHPFTPHDHTHRVSRGYNINGLWYFELRDGGQKGPFDNKEQMTAELDNFIQMHDLMNKNN